MLESLFNKVVDLKTRNLIKKRLGHRCFPGNIEKFLRKTYEHIWWLLLIIHCEHLLFKFLHAGKVGLQPGTRDPGSIHGTRDPESSTWDQGPLHRTRDLASSPWDLSPGARDKGPYIRDSIQKTNTWDQSKKTHFVYQSTGFCIVLILIYCLQFGRHFLIIVK